MYGVRKRGEPGSSPLGPLTRWDFGQKKDEQLRDCDESTHASSKKKPRVSFHSLTEHTQQQQTFKTSSLAGDVWPWLDSDYSPIVWIAVFAGNSPHGPTVKTAATRREFRPHKTDARLWAAPVCGLAVKHEPLGITWPALCGSYESLGHVVFVVGTRLWRPRRGLAGAQPIP